MEKVGRRELLFNLAEYRRSFEKELGSEFKIVKERTAIFPVRENTMYPPEHMVWITVDIGTTEELLALKLKYGAYLFT